MAAKKIQGAGLDVNTKRDLIEPGARRKAPSIRRQCQLIGLNRSGWYRSPVQVEESPENRNLMQRIDELYTRHPFYGSRKMVAALSHEGWRVNRKRIQRLMRVMGIQSVAPRPHTSQPHPQHKIFPYLLRNRSITRPGQVYSTDITYVRIGRGFAYLTAVVDWYSRKVLSWRLSNTMDASFCVEALREALATHGSPEIFNTDQGSQFTSDNFIQVLKDHQVRISMDGRGRALDNIFVERLWRSVKYEEIYLKQYQSMQEAKDNLADYFQFFNEERPHQALNNQTPNQVHHTDDHWFRAA